MALFPTPNLDFTDKDHDSFLVRLRNAIKSVFPTWTDEKVANFGNILLESFAFVFDNLAFYQDALARETRWVTATQRKALIALAKLINFEPETAAPATADVDFTLAAVPSNDVVIPAGTIVQTQEITSPVLFRLLEAVTIAAGADPPTESGTVENSTEQGDAYTSLGTANQEFRLTSTGYIDGTLEIEADNGTYTEVDSFLSSTSTDLHFTVIVDENDYGIFRFGNGINGAIPVGAIAATYNTGGGTAGNVDEGDISVIPGTFRDVADNIVSVSVSNEDKASGGQERESVASIRQRAPETLRVITRAVAREDFQIIAEAVPGVARALMLTSDEDDAVEENSGDLFIIPEGGGAPSAALKALVLAEFEGDDPSYPAPVGFDIEVLDPNYEEIDVRAVIYLAANADADTVKEDVELALADFFAVRNADGSKNTNVLFGYEYKDADGDPDPSIALSDVQNVVRDTTGVRKIGDLITDFTLNGEHRDVTVEMKQFPSLGDVVLINGATGSQM